MPCSCLDDRALALNLCNDLWVEGTLLGKTHLSCEGSSWLPGLGCSWGCLFHHSVDLFKGQSLGFINEEVGVDNAAEAKRTPKEEDLCAEVGFVGVDKVWSDDSDDLEGFVSISNTQN